MPARKYCGSIEKRKDLLGGAFVVEVSQHDQSEAPAQQTCRDARGRQTDKLLGRDLDPQRQAEDDDDGCLGQRDQGLADDLAEDDRVARDRTDEDLLHQVVLAIGDERDEAERRRLKEHLGVHAREGEPEQVEVSRLAEAGLQAAAKRADQDDRENQRRNDARAVDA